MLGVGFLSHIHITLSHICRSLARWLRQNSSRYSRQCLLDILGTQWPPYETTLHIVHYYFVKFKTLISRYREFSFFSKDVFISFWLDMFHSEQEYESRYAIVLCIEEVRLATGSRWSSLITSSARSDLSSCRHMARTSSPQECLKPCISAPLSSRNTG